MLRLVPRMLSASLSSPYRVVFARALSKAGTPTPEFNPGLNMWVTVQSRVTVKMGYFGAIIAVRVRRTMMVMVK